MRLAKYLLALALALAPMSAFANTVTIPNTFQNGQFIDANLFNQNFQSIATFANGNIDNANIGGAGIYASQIKPATGGQATFGGTIAYTFLVAPIMSGASITAATIPNSALLTPPVTNVTGSGNMASSGGTTPNITLSNNPTFFNGTVTAQNFGIKYTGFGDAQLSADTAGGINFTDAPAAPTYGFRFFANSAGTLNQLLSINTTGVASTVSITATQFNGSGAGLTNVPNTFPMYDNTGATLTNRHYVSGACNQVNSQDCDVALTGAAVFSSNTSYWCGAIFGAANVNEGYTYQVLNMSGSGFRLHNTSGPQVYTRLVPYFCVGS